MRKSASEIINELEMRIARLENRSASTQREAGPGAGVDVCLSGKSRNVRCLNPDIDADRLRAGRRGAGEIIPQGKIFIQDVTIASYYNSKNIHDDVAIIEAKDLDLDLDSYDVADIEEINFTGHCELENTMVGGGYTRGSAPDYIEVSGELEVEIKVYGEDYDVEMIPFTAIAKTSKEFQLMYDNIDEIDEDEDY